MFLETSPLATEILSLQNLRQGNKLCPLEFLRSGQKFCPVPTLLLVGILNARWKFPIIRWIRGRHDSGETLCRHDEAKMVQENFNVPITPAGRGHLEHEQKVTIPLVTAWHSIPYCMADQKNAKN